jgi:hypothetical protein
MSFGTRVQFDAVREVAFGGIGAAYAAVGAATSDYTRLVRFVNGTDADVYVSLDNATDHLRVAANSFVLLDLTANKVKDNGFFIANLTTFYVKRVSGAPSSGTFWIEVMSAAGGR